MTHYHVIAALYGCLPSDEPSIHENYEDAVNDLKYVVRQLRDGGNTLIGSVKRGRFDLSKKTDAMVDYVEIVECEEADCLKNIEDADAPEVDDYGEDGTKLVTSEEAMSEVAAGEADLMTPSEIAAEQAADMAEVGDCND